MAGIGLAAGVILALSMLVAAWREFRAGEPPRVWGGEAISAIGWGGMLTVLASGIPYLFWIGPENLPAWQWVVPAVVAIAFAGVAAFGMHLMTSGPLPPLDRTPRTARVVLNTMDGEGLQDITVRYRGADHREHDAELADLIDDSWVERFAPGSTWRIYAFASPDLADAVVFLTEEHDEVWRDGYKLNGVRIGGDSGPLTPGPGSPFLRAGGKWTFAEAESER